MDILTLAQAKNYTNKSIRKLEESGRIGAIIEYPTFSVDFDGDTTGKESFPYEPLNGVFVKVSDSLIAPNADPDKGEVIMSAAQVDLDTGEKSIQMLHSREVDNSSIDGAVVVNGFYEKFKGTVVSLFPNNPLGYPVGTYVLVSTDGNVKTFVEMLHFNEVEQVVPIDPKFLPDRESRQEINLNEYGFNGEEGIERLIAAGGGLGRTHVDMNMTREFWESINPWNPPVLVLLSEMVVPGTTFFTYPTLIASSEDLYMQIQLMMNGCINTVNIALVRSGEPYVDEYTSIKLTVTSTPIPGV